jgi:hypothetical protein
MQSDVRWRWFDNALLALCVVVIAAVAWWLLMEGQ